MKRKYWMMGLLCSGMVLAFSGCGKKKDAEPTPIPTVEELNAHVWGEEFHACIIEQAEFEAIWETHTYDGVPK